MVGILSYSELAKIMTYGEAAAAASVSELWSFVC